MTASGTNRPDGRGAAWTRRDFLRRSAVLGAVAGVGATAPGADAWPSGIGDASGSAVPSGQEDGPVTEHAAPLRIGLIGCGGRGTGAAINALQADPATRIVALADLFENRLAQCRQYLAENEPVGPRAIVEDDRCWVGFDAYEKLLATGGVDVVILATPPHFRPIHLEAAIAAGTHVFLEKPVAVDPVGVRRVIAAGEAAAEKGLSIVAGTQRRHQASYRAAMERVAAGALGRLVSARCYWNQGGLWVHERGPDESDMEWQVRNWLYFCWLSGDHIVEQHIHNLDVVNWAAGGPPSSALGVGGRQVRTDPAFGNVFDHFAIEYAYPNGMHLLSMCRQIEGTPGRCEEIVEGTKGRLVASYAGARIEGDEAWTFEGENPNPYVQEHVDLIAAIRGGTPVNEARRVAESTMTAILGRLAAYTGRDVTWDEAMASDLDLSPPAYAFGDLPVRDVALPGQTERG